MSQTLVLTPHGSLTLRQEADTSVPELKHRLKLERAFARGAGHGLLYLGADEVGAPLPPVLSYWRELGTRYLTTLCALPGIGDGRTKFAIPVPPDDELNRMAAAAPPMTGAEYLAASVLADLWREWNGKPIPNAKTVAALKECDAGKVYRGSGRQIIDSILHE